MRNKMNKNDSFLSIEMYNFYSYSYYFIKWIWIWVELAFESIGKVHWCINVVTYDRKDIEVSFVLLKYITMDTLHAIYCVWVVV